MHSNRGVDLDSTAVRLALWRAMQVQVDPPPHVFEDEVGLKLAAPPDGWRNRPDMSPSRGLSALRSWPALVSSRISSRSKLPVTSGSTSSSGRARTLLPSADRTSLHRGANRRRLPINSGFHETAGGFWQSNRVPIWFAG